MHHANLIIGNKIWGLEQVQPCDREPCADVSIVSTEHLSIGDVRSILYEAGLMPVERPYRSFVIHTEKILSEAQNALLKLFEEPNAHTVFYLIIPREDMLLPTLRSRMMLLAVEKQRDKNTAFTEFLQHGYAERLDMITERLKDNDADWIRAIVEGFSLYAHASRNVARMHDALMLESNIYTNGASKKMLLEHIALSLDNLVKQ